MCAVLIAEFHSALLATGGRGHNLFTLSAVQFLLHKIERDSFGKARAAAGLEDYNINANIR